MSARAWGSGTRPRRLARPSRGWARERLPEVQVALGALQARPGQSLAPPFFRCPVPQKSPASAPRSPSGRTQGHRDLSLSPRITSAGPEPGPSSADETHLPKTFKTCPREWLSLQVVRHVHGRRPRRRENPWITRGFLWRVVCETCLSPQLVELRTGVRPLILCASPKNPPAAYDSGNSWCKSGHAGRATGGTSVWREIKGLAAVRLRDAEFSGQAPPSHTERCGEKQRLRQLRRPVLARNSAATVTTRRASASDGSRHPLAPP